jgi:hypothetical protein
MIRFTIPETNKYPDLEHIFTFLDIIIVLSEGL